MAEPDERDGGDSAPEDAAPFADLYEELHALAGRYMRAERAGHTLQATALVHEAWLRIERGQMPPISRGQFYCAAAAAMRRILINHARDRRRLKRGGVAQRVALDISHVEGSPRSQIDLVALNDALNRLDQQDRLKARLVELRFFAGLDNASTAEALGISLATVKRQWTAARAWLRHMMDAEDVAGH